MAKQLSPADQSADTVRRLESLEAKVAAVAAVAATTLADVREVLARAKAAQAKLNGGGEGG